MHNSKNLSYKIFSLCNFSSKYCNNVIIKIQSIKDNIIIYQFIIFYYKYIYINNMRVLYIHVDHKMTNQNKLPQCSKIYIY